RRSRVECFAPGTWNRGSLLESGCIVDRLGRGGNVGCGVLLCAQTDRGEVFATSDVLACKRLYSSKRRCMRVAIAFPGCHRRGGVERVMLECANFLDSQGHETHAFATQWDETRLRPGVVRHPVAAPSRPYLMRLLGFLRQSRRDMAHLRPSADVCCGF